MRHARWLTFVLTLVVSSIFALADPRPFTFTYDTYPEGKGNVEYEQWVTYRTHTQEDHSFTTFDFRHELEVGITDNFDLSVYIPTWRYEDTNDHTGSRFDTVGIEGILYLLNPVTDPIGLGLYGEIDAGEDELEFEYKLLLQKDWKNWTFAYNLIVETAVQGIFTNKENEVEGVLGHAIGVSYALSPARRIGGETTIESIFDEWRHYEDTTVYAGPTFAYAASNWWVTVTPMFQLSSVDDEPDFQVRLLAGIEF